MRRIGLSLLTVVMLFFCSAALSEFVFSDATVEDSTPPPQATPTATPQSQTPVEILITAVGDVTLGGNMKDNPKSTIYTRELERQNGDLTYFFKNVREIFESDDLTIVNFEGTLTNKTEREKDNSFHFRAPPEHIGVLTSSSVEAVSFENNHTMDYGQQGWDDTVRAFEENGIVYASMDHVGVFETKGVKIAMLAYQTFNGAYPMLHERVPADIAAARETHDIVIVSFHWGDEGEYMPNSKQEKLGRATVDAGADLVLGHHSHRINPIEYYNGKYIVYSLSNFSFSGNNKPSDMDTFLYQQKFTVAGGAVTPGPFRIIPASISSNTGLSGAKSDENDFCVTPFPEGSKGIQRVLDRLSSEGKKLPYGVTEYPTEWPK